MSATGSQSTSAKISNPAIEFDPGKLVRPHIHTMPPYEPVQPLEVLSKLLGIPVDALVKLDANENPYGPLPQVSEALSSLPFTHIYPDPESRALRKAIASHLDLPEDIILAGAGVDELIDLVMRLCIEPGDGVINCPPTFGMYEFDGNVNRARIIQVPRMRDFSLDMEAIEKAVWQHQPKLLFLASPNNPDGSLVPRQEIERLLQLPVIVVLDEAYIEFSPPGSSLSSEVPTRQNLIVLRTFSKWAGLAGLRVGYGIFPQCLVTELWKIKQPYNVSVAASAAAIVSLQHKEELQVTGQRIISERERLYKLLQSIPWLKPYPSAANFILCQVSDRDAGVLKTMLAKDGILIRYFQKPGLHDHIRISIGKPEHTDTLIRYLRNLDEESEQYKEG
jgi:histidinol-phosphate aminotransferase